MFDLKANALHGDSFHALRGPIVIPLVLAIVAISAAAFFLNAVLAFAITSPDGPQVRPAVTRARAHLPVILGSGAVVGLMLGVSTVIVTRWGRPWFALSLGIMIGVMMVCYLAVPSRLIGVKPPGSTRDKFVATAVSGTLGAVICTPPYVLGRLGILMLGSPDLLVPGIILMTFGFTAQAGATGAVRAVKFSSKLLAGTAIPA